VCLYADDLNEGSEVTQHFIGLAVGIPVAILGLLLLVVVVIYYRR